MALPSQCISENQSREQAKTVHTYGSEKIGSLLLCLVVISESIYHLYEERRIISSGERGEKQHLNAGT